MQGDVQLRLKHGGAAAWVKACGGSNIGSSPEQPILGNRVLGATLSGGKQRGTCGSPYLGIVGRGEVVAHSHNSELLFLKPGNGVGNALVVLRL
jgi:hypothetical protein